MHKAAEMMHDDDNKLTTGIKYIINHDTRNRIISYTQ